MNWASRRLSDITGGAPWLPLVVLLIGIVLRVLPGSFDLRRSLLRSRVVSNRRSRSR